MTSAKQNNRAKLLPKSPTGIPGMDEITGGGLPKGRPTLVAGGAGCGKTLFAMEFLVNGATQYNEPGVFVAFEENAEELAQNVASLGFDLKKLGKQKKLIVDHVRVERSEIEETGTDVEVTSDHRSIGEARLIRGNSGNGGVGLAGLLRT